MSNTNSALFLVGGTGGLGAELAKGLVTAAGFSNYVALVRPSSVEKAQPLAALGWTIQEVNDFHDTANLTTALQGAKVVVSTAGGADMVDIEKCVIDASKKAGAELFVPSQFGVDYRRWKGEFPLFAGKKTVLAHAEQVGLPTLSVFCGMFSDFIFYFLADIPNMSAQVVAGGKANFSFTKRSDIGFVLAKALADPAYASGGYLSIQGDKMSWADALSKVETKLGKKFQVTDFDPAEALKKEQDLLATGNIFGAFALHLLGEPARGSTGSDVSEEAQMYAGVELESLDTTLAATFQGDGK